MTIGEILAAGSGGLLALLCMIQISPIKWNPWTAMARALGRAINGEVLEKISEVEKRMQSMEDKQAETAAKSARTRILRFADEIYLCQRHSKEHFDNILADISDYDHYCATHPNFENERTVMASRWIKETYRTCQKKHSFLSGDENQ